MEMNRRGFLGMSAAFASMALSMAGWDASGQVLKNG